MPSVITVAIENELLEEIDVLAASELRNRSSMVRLFLSEGVRYRDSSFFPGCEIPAPASASEGEGHE